jgi:hypothetical protein
MCDIDTSKLEQQLPIISKTNEQTPIVEETIQKENNVIIDYGNCIVCGVIPRQHKHVPCKHIVCCINCSLKSNNCALCGMKIYGDVIIKYQRWH